jgi:pimeloyl-ACP methyl ester carboxylesterase
MLQRHYSKRVEGVRLHWAELGEGAKPPLVLIHGLNDCYRTWKHLASRLAVDRRVLMLDLPGHGLSERPDATYELEWYGRVVSSWLAALGLDRVDLVGHSFGGGVAQVLVCECPERIRRLVLVSSGGLGREVAMYLRLASVPRVVEYFGQMFMSPCTKLALRATRHVLSKKDVARLAVINAQRGSARAFARTVKHVIDWRGQRRNFFERAHEMRLPAMAVFWGVRDTVIPVKHARDLARYVEGLRLVEFERSGHYPHHEDAEAFGYALRDFLDALHVPPSRVSREAHAKHKTRNKSKKGKAAPRWTPQSVVPVVVAPARSVVAPAPTLTPSRAPDVPPVLESAVPGVPSGASCDETVGAAQVLTMATAKR